MIQTEDWLMNLSTEIDLNPLKLGRVYTATVQKTFFVVVKLRANRQKTKDKQGPEIGSVMA